MEKPDTSNPVDFLLRAAADESRVGRITRLQHSHLQNPGITGLLHQPQLWMTVFLISCSLIRRDDTVSFLFSPPLASLFLSFFREIYLHPDYSSGAETWVTQYYLGVKKNVQGEEPQEGGTISPSVFIKNGEHIVKLQLLWKSGCCWNI